MTLLLSATLAACVSAGTATLNIEDRARVSDRAWAQMEAEELKAGSIAYEWKTLLSSSSNKVLLLGPVVFSCPESRSESLKLLPELKAAGFTHVLHIDGLDIDDDLSPLKLLYGSMFIQVPGAPPEPDPLERPLKKGEVSLPQPPVDTDSLRCGSSLIAVERRMAGLAALLKAEPSAKAVVLFGADKRLQEAVKDILSWKEGLEADSFRFFTWTDRPYPEALPLAGLADKRILYERPPDVFLNAPAVLKERCEDYEEAYPRRIESYACKKSTETLERIFQHSDKVLKASTSAAAELEHLRSFVDKTLDIGLTQICFCRTPQARGLAGWFGTLTLDMSLLKAPLPEASATFWHEMQHIYDQEGHRKIFTHTLESEKRAWRAGCLVGAEGEPCRGGFPRAAYCDRVGWAAEEVLRAQGEALDRACAEMERGTRLSAEGFKPSWSTEECLRRAKGLTSSKGWESSEKYCAECGPKSGWTCSEVREAQAPVGSKPGKERP